MERNEIVNLLTEYDFNQNSKISFARKYNISVKTVNNYLKRFNIKVNKMRLQTNRNRDQFGRFTFQNMFSSDKELFTSLKYKTNDPLDKYTTEYSYIFK